MICSLSATKSSHSLQNTVKREILLFYPPVGKIDGYKPNIFQLPYRKKVEIFVKVFLRRNSSN